MATPGDVPAQGGETQLVCAACPACPSCPALPACPDLPPCVVVSQTQDPAPPAADGLHLPGTVLPVPEGKNVTFPPSDGLTAPTCCTPCPSCPNAPACPPIVCPKAPPCASAAAPTPPASGGMSAHQVEGLVGGIAGVLLSFFLLWAYIRGRRNRRHRRRRPRGRGETSVSVNVRVDHAAPSATPSPYVRGFDVEDANDGSDGSEDQFCC